jgi:hypothetical protein
MNAAPRGPRWRATERWLRPAQLHALPMPPADGPLIALLEAVM